MYKYALIDENSCCIGEQQSTVKIVNDKLKPIATNESFLGMLFDDKSGFFTTTEREKKRKQQQIKEQAAERINALKWKVERANERLALGVVGANDELLAVYQERENIRQASNKAEIELNKKRSVKAVSAFTW